MAITPLWQILGNKLVSPKIRPTDHPNAHYCLNEHGNAATYPMEADICVEIMDLDKHYFNEIAEIPSMIPLGELSWSGLM
jgi:hypothetical protein